jgi:hypothetical protein
MNSDAYQPTFAQHLAEIADRTISLSKTDVESCEYDYSAGFSHGHIAGYAAGFAAGRAAALGGG